MLVPLPSPDGPESVRLWRSSFQQRAQDFRASRIRYSSSVCESVHAPIRIKSSRTAMSLAPGTHRCPRKSLVPDRVQRRVTASQKGWFSKPATCTCDVHSFPTRRSSDLLQLWSGADFRKGSVEIPDALDLLP